MFSIIIIDRNFNVLNINLLTCKLILNEFFKVNIEW